MNTLSYFANKQHGRQLYHINFLVQVITIIVVRKIQQDLRATYIQQIKKKGNDNSVHHLLTYMTNQCGIIGFKDKNHKSEVSF